MPYKHNIEMLAKRNPQLAELVNSAKLTGRYVIAPSQRKDKLPSMVDLKFNKNFYNNIDPFRVAELDIKNRKIRLGDMAVFLGFGLGYEVYEYINKFPHARVMIIEGDVELLKTAFSAVKYTDLLSSPNVHFVGGPNLRLSYPYVFNYLNMSVNIHYLKSINILEQPICYYGNREYYSSALQLLKEGIQQVLLLYGNDPQDSLLGIKYTLRNIPTIIDNPGILELENIFKGKPGIVVASGPSLNKNMHLLKDIREKAVICAADGSVKILKNNDLPPAHMVTSLERVIATSQLFEGLTPEDVKDSYLAACPVVVPETYANFPGDKIIVYRNFATFDWLNIKRGILDIGPSAGNMAFKILEFLGCDPIILVGQDLSMTDDLQTHAKGFHYGTRQESLLTNLIEIEGNYQEKVKTEPIYKQFLLHYERDVASYKGTVINATEGGAKIHGTQLMTFQEAIDKYITTNIDTTNTIKRALKYPKQKEKEKNIKETLKKLHHANKFCNEIIEVCQEGLHKCAIIEEIMKRTDCEPQGEDVEVYKKNLDEVVKIPLKFVGKDFYYIVMHYVQSIYIKIIQDINYIKFSRDDGAERDTMLFLKHRELFAVMIGLLKVLIIEFNVSIEIMEKYQEEFLNNKEK